MSPALVTPTYNERDNLEHLVLQVREALPETTLYVVDDGSPDGTGQLAEQLGERLSGIHVIHREGKLGLGSAYREGFARALADGHDPIFQMDADLSHDPRDLPRLLALCAPQGTDSGADLALGSRYVPGGGTRNWPLRRRILSRAGTAYARLLLDLPYRDLTGGFKCWRARCLQGIDLSTVRSEGYVFQVETTLRAFRRGFHIRELPIIFTERSTGRSKMSTRIACEAAWRVPALRLRD